MSDTVLQETRGGVAILTLNRPDKLNAFNEEQHITLRAAFESAGENPAIRAVVLTGAGRGFCAGQDLGDRAQGDSSAPRDLGATLDQYYNPLVRLIRSLEKPVICAVNGVAAGAGANVALACDMVIAARSAKFIQAFCKIGLIPDSGGTFTLTRLLGEARAKALMMTGAPISAETAADWGLIWQVVDDAALMETALELATGLAAAPTLSLGLTKQAIQVAHTNTMDQQLDLERDLQRIAGASDDYREGVTAFLEKRKPVFTGK
ncbi:MAG: 2-(1,2-epoxy-1,2-dihydrophenyl)acetyl-CoA isomerase PaaG [Magnetospiraceae bacterium]